MTICKSKVSLIKIVSLPKKIFVVSLGLLFLFLGVGCKQKQDEKLNRFVFEKPNMGTVFRLVLYAPDSLKANEWARSAFQEIESINQVLSDYDAESELMQLASTAGKDEWVPVSEVLWEVLSASREAHAMSLGAFDITAGSLIRLWRRAIKTGVLPSEERLEAAKLLSGQEFLLFDDEKKAVKLLSEGMRLDLGGIAKGFTADKILQLLANRNCSIALVDAGGDITVGDPPPGEKAWEILVPPIDSLGSPEKLLLRNSAVATSGDLYQFLEKDGVRYSHLINPKTGVALTETRQVTVIAANGMQADWLASALSIMDDSLGIKLVDSLSNVAVRIMILDEEGKQEIISRGFL